MTPAQGWSRVSEGSGGSKCFRAGPGPGRSGPSIAGNDLKMEEIENRAFFDFRADKSRERLFSAFHEV
jgi:hypothetical protein